MMGHLKRLLGLLLVLTTSAWSQAVCPMMLFPQSSPSCGTHQKAAAASAASKGSEHKCCPRERKAKLAHEECPTKGSGRSSTMKCCSIDRPLATSGKAVQTSPDVAVFGRVLSSALHVSRSTCSLEITDTGPPLRGVLNLKEDMRI